MNTKLNFIVKCLIVTGMILGVALFVWVAADALKFSPSDFTSGELVRIFVSAGLALLCLVGCEYIAFTLLSMMRSLDGNPFCVENVTALRRMGFTALAVMACGLLTMAFWAVPLAVVGALPVGMCGLFSLVLSGVFARAVAFKEENDLTV